MVLSVSGEEAVEKALSENSNIDLLLMDIDLGRGMDGTEAAGEILKKKDIPILFLSSHTEPEVVEKTEKITSYGYVVKNSGIVVLDASIKMAFKLFEARTTEKEKSASLRQSEIRLKEAQRMARLGSWELDLSTGRVYWSDEMYNIFDIHPSEYNVTYEEFLSVVHPDDREAVDNSFKASVEKCALSEIVHRLLMKDGSVKYVQERGETFCDSTGRPVRSAGTVQDVTERKLDENERDAMSALLNIINSSSTKEELIMETTGFLKKHIGCESIGIRLKNGFDYPYYMTFGFPETFIEAERYLCSRGIDGSVELDSSGSPVLECMCGMVLSGNVDFSKSYFTHQGSFWTNDTTALIAAGDVLLSRARNRCNSEGYESVGLFPMRCRGDVCGLLQVNDRRKGFFDQRMLDFLERFAANLTIAIARFNLSDMLYESEERLRSFFEQTSESIVIADEEGKIIEWNRASERMTGLSKERAIGMNYWDMMMLFVPKERRSESRRDELRKKILVALRSGKAVVENESEFEFESLNGERKITRQSVFTIKTGRGYRIGSLSKDVTEVRRS